MIRQKQDDLCDFFGTRIDPRQRLAFEALREGGFESFCALIESKEPNAGQMCFLLDEMVAFRQSDSAEVEDALLIKCIQYLMGLGAEWQAALRTALKGRWMGAVGVLLSYDRVQPTSEHIYMTATTKDTDLLKLLIEQTERHVVSGSIYLAASLDDWDVVRMLFGSGAVLEPGEFERAAESDSEQCLPKLIKASRHHSIPSLINATKAMRSAIGSGDIELVRVLLQAGAHVTRGCLELAAFTDPGTLKLILSGFKRGCSLELGWLMEGLERAGLEESIDILAQHLK